tara:strand:- start:136 stop:888 length:753 start_codon:yes stop_codon:yes gene_type:complete
MRDLNTIHTTDKYNFTLVDGNRKIKSVKIKILSDSIKKYGLFNPINVNRKGYILDGQHRYLSCKALGIPVKYIISDINVSNKELVSLIRDINSVQTNWNNKDIGYAYSIHADNKESYEKYLELVNMGVSHSTVIEACGMLSKGDRKAKSCYIDFKNGTMIITDGVKYRVSGQIKMLADSKIDKKVWNRIYFIRALLKLRQQKDFEAYQFIDNFNKYPQKWMPAYTVNENINSIIKMHNHKARSKAKYYFT